MYLQFNRKWLLQLVAVILLSISYLTLSAANQDSVKGRVLELDDKGVESPLPDANVFWLGTTEGTTTDEEGYFELERVEEANKLVISFVGYQSDTIELSGQTEIRVVLSSSIQLAKLRISSGRNSSEMSLLNPVATLNISQAELEKAACCNLSESFDTSPSVDVSFTDAITGTKQIQLLGLSGPYSSITIENMPGIRGLAAVYGLSFLPGTWLDGIQLNKGTGSVVNGFESIAGQINLELLKPEVSERVFINLFGNDDARLEANIHNAHRFNPRLSTLSLVHANYQNRKQDINGDGFMDMPNGYGFTGLNRWKYFANKGWRFQAGLMGNIYDRYSGQMGFARGDDPLVDEYWAYTTNIKGASAWAKAGKVFENSPGRSLGMQLSGSVHRQESAFGRRRYNGNEDFLFGHFLYQDIIRSTDHKYRVGLNIIANRYEEELGGLNFDRSEFVQGGYLEYTWTQSDKFAAVAGIRADYHNEFGFFVTPRLHVRYAPAPKTVFRLSVGSGQRTANVLSENFGLMASSREFLFEGDGNPQYGYGLKQEKALNLGINFTQKFTLAYREGAVTMDYYRTEFLEQSVVNVDRDPGLVVFEDLSGSSYSNSLQFQVDYELIKRLDFRFAYRWLDVQTSFDGQLMEKPLISKHRAFVNLAYATRSYWTFNVSVNWQSSKRLPGTESNPEEYRLDERSPDFTRLNVQISKTWRERFDIYLGAENLLNFFQSDPILAADDPFGPYFDSSMVWGPVMGRSIYTGLRFYLP